MKKYYYLSDVIIPKRPKAKWGRPEDDPTLERSLQGVTVYGKSRIPKAQKWWNKTFRSKRGYNDWIDRYYNKRGWGDNSNNDETTIGVVTDANAKRPLFNLNYGNNNTPNYGFLDPRRNWLSNGWYEDVKKYNEENGTRLGETSPFMRGVKQLVSPLHLTLATVPTLGFGALGAGAAEASTSGSGIIPSLRPGPIWGNALSKMGYGIMGGTAVNLASKAFTGKTFDEHSYNVLTNDLGINPTVASYMAPMLNLGYTYGGGGINKLLNINGVPKVYTPTVTTPSLIGRGLSSRLIPSTVRNNPGYRNAIGGMESYFAANNRFGFFNQRPVPIIYKNLVDANRPKPFIYDSNGNFIPNENYNFRNGWGITSDAIQTGRIRTPEGNYKPEVFEKYPFLRPKKSFATINENFEFPYFQKGEVIWPFETGRMPEDLIAIPNNTLGVEFPKVGKFGNIIAKESSIGDKTTPIINGKTNQFPTNDAMLFKFNPETNRYEYYNNPNAFNYPVNPNHTINLSPQAWGKYSPYYKNGMSTAILTNPNGIKAINTPPTSYFSAVNDYDNWLYNNGFTKNKVGISNNTNGIVIGEEPPWIEDAQRVRAEAKGVDYDSAEMLTEEDISTPIRTNLTGKRVNSDFPSYNDRAIAADYINKYTLDNYGYSLNLDADNLAHIITNSDNGFTKWIMRQGSYNDPRVKDIYNRINNSYLRDIRLVKEDPQLAYSIPPQSAKKLGIKPYGVYNTKDPAKLYTKTHEADHVLLEPSEPIPQGVLEFPTISRHYFEHGNNADVSTRLSQILNFHNIRDARKFTGLQLKHMFEDYLKTKQLDNNMTDLYNAVKDWDGLANWMNNPKNVLQLGIPISVGIKLLNNDK